MLRTHAEAQCARESMADGGAFGHEFVCPTHGREVLLYQMAACWKFNRDTSYCHFQVVDGDGTLWVGVGQDVCLDFRWPQHTPDNRLQVVGVQEPDPADACFASVNVADVSPGARDKELAVGRVLRHLFEEGAKVFQGLG